MGSSRNLADHIAALIRTRGPLTVAHYMAESLNHPKWGYYASRNPLGRYGDFITAPEISQMFGELITAWLINCWERLGRPNPAIVVELGPGRGTLISDFWRIAQMVPSFSRAIEICLVETSPVLRKQQRHQLELVECSSEVTWVESFEEVAKMPLLLIANEFFDALPVRQYIRFGSNWRERLVDIDPTKNCGFRYVISPQTVPIPLMEGNEYGLADTLEVCPSGVSLAREIGERLIESPGAALILDYRSIRPELSLQAVRAHSSVDPLLNPGECDLSCAVDFKALGRVASDAGATVHGPVPQGEFLRSLGIEQRASKLVEKASKEESRVILQSKSRLIERAFMGELFHVLALTSQDSPIVEGFGIS